MLDLYHQIAVAHLLDPQDLARTDTKTKYVDLGGAVNAEGCILAALLGTITGVDGSSYLTITAEESDTTADTDFATVAAGSLNGAFTVVNSTAKDQLTQAVGYVGSKRYVRLKLTYTSTGITASLVGALAILGLLGAGPAGTPVTGTAA